MLLLNRVVVNKPKVVNIIGGKTSNKAKSEWKKRNYAQIKCDIDKQDGERFREKCKAENIPQAQILKKAVYDFIGKPVPPNKTPYQD